DVSPETAEFPPNFAVREVSDETAESIPLNFALGTISTKPSNFSRISHSGTFPPKWPNQSRRISAEFRTRDVSAETAESIPPNFRRVSHSGTFPTKRPNFRRISPSGTFPTKWQNFRRI
ncbi:MAG: hypothetical protein Q8881_03050, partial [Sweet potato little leaf phytoplasma]|nr:hypothetical protein [Sweet potato little leaf phytoplasma]